MNEIKPTGATPILARIIEPLYCLFGHKWVETRRTVFHDHITKVKYREIILNHCTICGKMREEIINHK